MDPMTALRDSSLFEGLPESRLEALVDRAILREYGLNDAIFRQGEDAFGICIVLEGSVGLQEQIAGRLLQLRTLEPGDLLGWSGFVPPHTFTVTAIAMSKVKVAIIQMTDLSKTLAEDEHAGYVFAVNLAELISRRFHETQERLARNLVGW